MYHHFIIFTKTYLSGFGVTEYIWISEQYLYICSIFLSGDSFIWAMHIGFENIGIAEKTKTKENKFFTCTCR